MTPSEFFRDLAQVFGGPLPEATKQQAAEIFLEDVHWQLIRGKSPDGTPFVPLKYPRPEGGTYPLINTGNYARSFGTVATATGVALTSTHPAVMVHQHGATIRPKRAKALAIPLTIEAKQAGSPRSMANLMAMKGGLFESIGSSYIQHWVFAKQVVIPPRPVGISKAGQEAIAELFVVGEIRQAMRASG